MNPESLIPLFRTKFSREPERIALAPGRVNLVGEHTDYNDGFVFPAAIDRGIAVAAARRPDRMVGAWSASFNQAAEFSLERIERSDDVPWNNYIRGVFLQFLQAGYDPPGMDLVLDGDVPIGSGLSSSAALEVATAVTIRDLAGIELAGTRLALMCQAAEREFVGVSCGIMDQFISTLGEEDRALFIDCRDLSFESVPLDPDLRIVVCDSKVQRRLDSSAYNQRRGECEAAVSLLQSVLGPIRALRDVTSGQLDTYASLLPEPIRRRARHVVTENERVSHGIELLRQGQVDAFGKLLHLSHESLRQDYEVSCPELDVLVELALGQSGTVGARMTGAGFGGCTVNLVRTAAVEDWIPAVREGYLARTGRSCEVYPCRAAAGARTWRP